MKDQKLNIIYVVTMLLVVFVIYPRDQQLFDFRLYWNATKHFFTGLNPYSPFSAEILRESDLIFLNEKFNFNVLSPPITFIILIPFVILGINLSKVLFFLLVLISLLLPFIFFKFERLNYKFIFIFPLGALISTYTWGGVSWILLISISLSSFFLQKRSNFLSGLSLSFTLIKPHLLGVFYIYLLFYFIKSKDYKFAFGIILAS